MLGENPDKGEEWWTVVGAHFVATSLADAVAICVREAHGADRELAPRRSNQPYPWSYGHNGTIAITPGADTTTTTVSETKPSHTIGRHRHRVTYPNERRSTRPRSVRLPKSRSCAHFPALIHMALAAA
jgi:hypothetical protein